MKDSLNVKVMGIKDVQLVCESFDESNLKNNEALIKNEMSLISSGTELSRVYGIKKGATYPMYPGYISVGTVLDKGTGLDEIEIGDLVMFNGQHRQFQRFTHHGRNLELILPLDKDLSIKQSVLIYLASIAMNGMLIADVKLGDTVSVFGLGTIGLLTAKLFQLAGAKVIAVDPIKSRTDDAKKIGIKYIVDCESDKQEEEIMRLTNGKGVDIAIDVAGVSPSICNAIQCTAFNGTVILSGTPRAEYQGNITNVFNRIHMRMLTVIGAYNDLFSFYRQSGSRLSVWRNMEFIKECLKSGDINVDDFISHEVAPQDVMSAYQGLMEDRENYKCAVIDWSKLNER